jgi:hypothetical protein
LANRLKNHDDITDYTPDNPDYMNNLDLLLERTRSGLTSSLVEEEAEGREIVEFAERPLSPATERILLEPSIFPSLAHERARLYRGIFVQQPLPGFLDEMEKGAVSCQTNWKDPRIRTDIDPKEDDPPEKVITFCTQFFEDIPSFIDILRLLNLHKL